VTTSAATLLLTRAHTHGPARPTPAQLALPPRAAWQADFQQHLAKARAAAAEQKAAAAREAAAAQAAEEAREAAEAAAQKELAAAAARSRSTANGANGAELLDEAAAAAAVATSRPAPPHVLGTPRRDPWGRRRQQASYAVAAEATPKAREGGGFSVELALSVRRSDLPSPPSGPGPSLRFLATRGIEELTVGDISQLLTEYKWLSHAVRRLDDEQQRTLGIIR